MFKKSSSSSSPLALVFTFLLCFAFSSCINGVNAEAFGEESFWGSGSLVKRDQRQSLVSTEYGEISAVNVTDNIDGSYLLHFFTLEPNSLFLPVILHANMVFYVHTGSGRLSWTEEDDLRSAGIRRGDVYRLPEGTAFFIRSNLETETERQKLRVHAIFANSRDDPRGPATGPYSSIRDMVLGFDRKVLQAAFQVPEDVLDDLLSGAKPPAIVHGIPTTSETAWRIEDRFIKSILGSRSYNILEKNKKKKRSEDARLFNLLQGDKDFENCNGWSTTATKKKLSALKDSNMGLFMVNLTIGSMMGPHWNPRASEISVVLQGRGMVRVVCSSITNETSSCRNMRYEVEEGDVFAVPRFHPMAQMAFNNETLVFMGFSTSAKKNHPQYLAGQASVLRTLDRDILATAFGVDNTTLDQFLAPQGDSVILGCVSCAEEEQRIMQEEMEREREEVREREAEEARRRQEEERREQEEARRREEEAAKREEEERKRREEEEERGRHEEEERERQEEEARRKEQEARERQEQEEAQRREQEEAEARQREQEREEEEARQREQEREEETERQEEEARERQEQEEAQRREQEEEEVRQREQEREGEEARRREEVRRKEHEQEEQEEARQREQEEEEARRREEKAARREGEREGGGRGGGGGGKSEGERAAEEERRREEEAQREEEEERGGGSGRVMLQKSW